MLHAPLLPAAPRVLRAALALLLLLGAAPLAARTVMVEAAAPGQALPELSPDVSALHLRGFGAEQIFTLRPSEALRELNLSDNALPVLPERFLPPTLTRLWLADNRLMRLPDSLGACRSLVYLNAERNLLDRLPPLAELPLRWLRLNGNRLETLPPLPPTLERLYAADNRLRAVPELPPACRQVTFAGNPLEALPAGWGAGLELLDLSRTPLSSLPADLAPWRSLKCLNLTRCPLSEAERDRIEAALPETFLLF